MIRKLEEELKNPVSESERRLILKYLHSRHFRHDNSIELLHDFFCNWSTHKEYMTKLIRLLIKICVVS